MFLFQLLSNQGCFKNNDNLLPGPRSDAFFVLDFRLDVLDGVIWFDVQGNRLSGEGLDENLHGTTSKSENKMQRRFLPNVVIRESSTVSQLFSSED